VTGMPNGPWFTSLPPCEALVPCGQGQHAVRWEAGELRLLSHADPEAELVLAALGGEKARCVEIAEAWGRHAADLTVLTVWPRDPAAGIVVSWDDVDAAGQAAQGGGGAGPVHGAMKLASPPTAAIARAAMRRRQYQQEAGQDSQRRLDMLSLLALGTEFQVRLSGQVAAAYADRLDEPDEYGRNVRSVLTAALNGRLAPVAERWLGIDPDQVKVSLHPDPGPGGYGGAGSLSQGGSGGMGPPGKKGGGFRGDQGFVPPGQHSWGSVELTGRGPQRRLEVSLPAWWLARVWACGLALTGRHLVVAVERAGWPDAQVLALRVPGAEPVSLSAHATGSPPGTPDAPHWEI
jgi:hypothetical protein